MFATIGKMVALGRPARSKDVAGIVSFLASDMADYMTGQTMVVDGMGHGLHRGPGALVASGSG